MLMQQRQQSGPRTGLGQGVLAGDHAGRVRADSSERGPLIRGRQNNNSKKHAHAVDKQFGLVNCTTWFRYFVRVAPL